MAAKDEKARRAGARNDLLLAPEVAELVADYFRYFISETHPLKPQVGEENKVGAAHKSKKAEEQRGDPSSRAWAELMILLLGQNADSEDAVDERLKMAGSSLTSPICTIGTNRFPEEFRLEVSRALNS